ncbi:hypothetical protein PIB30_024195 [Stylosanthes scabra]|uniref:CCHC-type domain-containing protein n=1 Tax=Stylosanthes scabra TaxID=79078 RepID=A0ABU6Q988_9FABA|nr:hypothetical protein [Stylosanthes scabra]
MEKVNGLENEEIQARFNQAFSTSLFNSVAVKFLEVSERASQSIKHHDAAIQDLDKLIKELDLLKVDEPMEDLTKCANQVTSMEDTITLRDPPILITKGRPPSIRMKSRLELQSKGSTTCSICNKRGHNKRRCPSSRNHTGYNVINIQDPNSIGAPL